MILITEFMDEVAVTRLRQRIDTVYVYAPELADDQGRKSAIPYVGPGVLGWIRDF